MSTGPGADSAPAPDHHDSTARPAPGSAEDPARRTAERQALEADAAPEDPDEIPVPAEDPATGRPDARTATDARTTSDATAASGAGTASDARTPTHPTLGKPPTNAHAPAATPQSPADPEPPRRTSMFSSLRIRNYRLFFTGQVVSNIGTWMQRIAQDWLVLSLTGSSAAVGITTALQFLPMLLFGLYGGVLVDRLPKRQTLLVTQAVMGLTGLALAVLTLSDNVQVWHVYLTAFVLGLVTVVDNPARQTFVSEMVGPGMMRNAVSLNAANFQSARLVGPAVGGALITAVGSGYAFLLNGLSFIAPIVGLLLMRSGELHESHRTPRGKGQLREGLHYVAKRPELIWPIVLVFFVGTFGFNFPVWLSAFADDVFDAGAGTYAVFNILMAVGSLAGALLAARRARTRLRLLVGAAIAFGVLEIVASAVPSYWVFAALLVPIGMCGLTSNTTANQTVQMAAEPEMRGRVMSLYMMVFTGGTPVGGPLFGWLTDTYGARVGFATGGAITALAAVAVGLVLARIGGLRMEFGWNRGHPRLRFVPREGERAKELAAVA
ncbi:MFS transporter [Streptomyces sp. AM 3-1-1]|uniref:MFS transporter n=1 Tax=Streptomyces sp. AM 3-1-1 TaxID=3028711 RepID=UPI0023B90A0E|nr:MFS transporter [Streptomyces sp. AM 3-1-1]WEH28154.1 MFS transporter [Streptomyces sp. AM 3-1-1]